MKYLVALVLALSSTLSFSHEMTPAYPKVKASFINDVDLVSVTLFNRRADVQFYEVGAFDADWNPIPFVSQYKIYKVEYLHKVDVDIYLTSVDSKKVKYVCSRSKLIKTNEQATLVSSRICSRVVR